MIASLLHHLESVFAWLLTASWQASVLALVVLLAQRLLGTRLNPRWRHALWLLVLVRLLLPVLPESALSLFQFATPPPAPFVTIVTEPWHPIFTGQPYPAPSDLEPMAKPNYPFSSFTLLTLIWLTGALVLLVLTLEANRRFTRHVAHSPEISDPAILQAFADARAELHLRRPIRLIENSRVQSPAIMGLLRPTLLLPTDVRNKFDPRELRLIFLHELAHLQRGDLLIQALIALLQILHWFNPVLWYAFRRIRIDREPATDALVLSRAGEAEKERYGLMLIKLLQHFNQRHSLPTLVGILEDTDQFKRRFTLIARYTRGAYGWSLLGFVLICLLSIACLTKSKAAPITNDGTSRSVAQNTKLVNEADAKSKGIAATVDGHVITLDELREQWIPAKKDLEAHYSGKELQERLIEMGRKIPMKLIDRQLIIDDFKAKGGFIPKSYIDEQINYIIKEDFGGDRASFLQTVAERGSDEEKYRREIEENAIVGQSNYRFVEEKVEKYHDAHLDLFPVEEQLRVTMVKINGSVPVPAGHIGGFAAETDPRAALAREVLRKMREGADVSTFPAAEGVDRSDSGSRWVTRDRFPGWWPITWAQVEKLNPGETTDVTVGDGTYAYRDGPGQNYHYYYIVRLEERRAAKAPATLETAEQEKELLDAKGNEIRQAWLEGLRQKAIIQIFDAALTVDPWAKVPAQATPAPPGPGAFDAPDDPGTPTNADSAEAFRRREVTARLRSG